MSRLTLLTLLAMVALLSLAGYRLQQLNQAPVDTPQPLPVSVEVLTVEPAPFVAWAFAEGTAEAMHKAFLSFEEAGKVVFISQQADGTPIREGGRVFGPTEDVRLGQLLARLDNRENSAQVQALEARLQSARERGSEAKAQLNITRNNQRKAEHDFSRVEQLHDRGLIASNELERERTAMLNARDAVSAASSAVQIAAAGEKGLAAELNRATVSLEKTSLFAPFDGIITTMNLVENNYYYPPASAGTRKQREAGSAIVVIDDSRFEVQLEVPEYAVRHIREGQTVLLAQNDHNLYLAAEANLETPGVVSGKVWSVSPSLSLQRRAQLVKVRTEGNIGVLRDGMFVRAWVITHQKPAALALPLYALSFSDGQSYAFVISADGTAERRDLELGLRGLQSIEILNGLENGDRVVVRGQHLLTEGNMVRITGEH